MTDPETEFFSTLIELQYGQKVDQKLVELSKKVSWAKGWPENNQSFWNAEAFMWQHKIEKEKRQLIKDELNFLTGNKNLDLGCGTYSYLPSVGFDFSEKMLQFNENCLKKVSGDLEQKLPFAAEEFGSVTAVFVLNYVKNYTPLFSEIRRVLKEKGTFVMVLSINEINPWQRQKEINSFSSKKWSVLLEEQGFSVNCYQKENLWFFVARK